MTDPKRTRDSGLSILGMVLSAVALTLAILTVVLLRVEWEERPGTPVTAAVGGLAAVTALLAAMCIRVPRSWRQVLGLLLAGGAMLVGCFQCVTLPAVSRVRESARRATCRSHLRQIGLACHMYADDADEQFPPSFEELYPDYVDNARMYKCPSCKASWRDFGTGRVSEASSSYTYVPGLVAVMPGVVVMAYDKSLENHDREGKPSGRNVLYADAHVEWWPASREAEFQEKLRKQREAAEKWRAAGAKREDISKFFGRPGEEKK